MKKKSEIYDIVIKGYEEELVSGKILSIEDYLYNNKTKIYKDINFDLKTYSKTIEHYSSMNDLINCVNKKGRFTDYELDLAVQNYKIMKIQELDLDHVEEYITNSIIELHDRELAPYMDKIGVNYQNKFNSYQRKRIEDLIPLEMFFGLVFTKKEILDYFFNERLGYVQIIEMITYFTTKSFLIENGFNAELDVKEMEGKNKWEIIAHNLDNDKSFKFYMAFKDAQYWFFNDKDYQYINDFNLEKIIPDLKKYI